MMTMEQDIYNRAVAHYMKKYPGSATATNPTRIKLRDIIVITEFWDDYFDNKELFE